MHHQIIFGKETLFLHCLRYRTLEMLFDANKGDFDGVWFFGYATLIVKGYSNCIVMNFLVRQKPKNIMGVSYGIKTRH